MLRRSLGRSWWHNFRLFIYHEVITARRQSSPWLAWFCLIEAYSCLLSVFVLKVPLSTCLVDAFDFCQTIIFVEIINQRRRGKIIISKVASPCKHLHIERGIFTVVTSCRSHSYAIYGIFSKCKLKFY